MKLEKIVNDLSKMGSNRGYFGDNICDSNEIVTLNTLYLELPRAGT